MKTADTNSSNNYVNANWHFYFDQCDDSEQFPFEEYGMEKSGFTYMEDYGNGEYFSILDADAATDILKQVKSGKQLELHRVMHFTDDHAAVFSQIMNCDWLDASDLPELPRYACRQYVVLENPEISKLLFAHLLKNGWDVDAIMDEVVDAEISDDDDEAVEDFQDFLYSIEAQAA